MRDSYSGERIGTMEVYVCVEVDVADCGLVSEAYRRSAETVRKLEESIREGCGLTVTDSYEGFRNRDGELQDPKDGE